MCLALAAKAGSVSIGCQEIRLFEIRVVGQNFIFGHSASKHVEEIPDSDTKSSDAGLP